MYIYIKNLAFCDCGETQKSCSKKSSERERERGGRGAMVGVCWKANCWVLIREAEITEMALTNGGMPDLFTFPLEQCGFRFDHLGK